MNAGFVCTGDPTVIKDGKKSFPSGHSSCMLMLYQYANVYDNIIFLYIVLLDVSDITELQL